MKTEVKEISQCIRELQVTVEAAETNSAYYSVLNKIKKMVAIPGFRKGKAPNSMIEQHYHEYIKDEFLNQQVGEYYKQALDELKLSPVNQGEATDVKWEKGSDLVATYRFEVFPEIELKKYTDLEIPFEEMTFDDAMIEKTIADYRERMADEVDAEDVPAEGDLINATISFIDDDGNLTKSFDRSFTFKDNQYSKQFNNTIGKLKAGEETKTKLFTQKQKADDDEIDEGVKMNIFNVKINSIKHKVLPEVNDEFAKDLDYDSVEDMNAKIKADIDKNIETQNENRKRESILAQLVENNNFEVPQSMTKQYAESMAKPAAEAYKIDIEQVLPMYMQMAEFNLKSHYLMEEIKKNIEINISDEEKEELIKTNAENLKLDVEKYKKLYKKQIDSEDFTYSLEEKKVLEHIEKNSKFVPYPTPAEESEEVEADKEEDKA